MENFKIVHGSTSEVWKILKSLKLYMGQLQKAKRSAKQLQSEVINALASVYCYFLQAELNGYQKRKQATVVSC